MAEDPSTPQPESGDDPQRRRILDAALEVLRTQGSAALTVRNVAKGAGCSTSGVYTWFGGKPGLVEAIFVEGFRGFDAALAGAFADADDRTAPAVAYRSWALANPTQYLVMFGGSVPGWEPSPEALAVAGAAFQHLVDWVAVAGVANSEDTRREAMHLWATLHGYVMLDLAGMCGPVGDTPEELFRYGLMRMASSEPAAGSAAT